MTLRELLAEYPQHFYPQTWFHGEAFLDTPGEGGERPTKLHRLGVVPIPSSPSLPLAADMAAAYVQNPDAGIWKFFIWCRDVDRHGNPVYVGGIGHDDAPGFQIHRHLIITSKWGAPR